MTQDDDVKTIHVRPAGNYNARWDAIARSREALDQHADFFSNPEHERRVAAVRAILDDFLPIRKELYVNRRGLNTRKPRTVLKVESPQFPNHLPRAERERRYHKPLRDLGVEIKLSVHTNSYLYSVA
jgi:hypothetical protein